MRRSLRVLLPVAIIASILYVFFNGHDLAWNREISDNGHGNTVGTIHDCKKCDLNIDAVIRSPTLRVAHQERRLFFVNTLYRLRKKLVTQSMQHDSLQRSFLEFQPDTMAASAALVILLHGINQKVSSLFQLINPGTPRWLELSQKNGFLLLAPSALNGEWNDLRNPETEETDPDDVGFLKKVIEWAVTERKIDPSRVYITGASNGGMMTFRMLLEFPEMVTAGAAFLSTLPDESIITNITGVSPRPVFIMNGSVDPIIFFSGSNLTKLRSSDSTRDFFVQHNAATLLTNETLSDHYPKDNCRVTSEYYASATSPVQYYVLEGAGHVYPSTRRLVWFFHRLTRWYRGSLCREVDGVELAWDFMSHFHRLPRS